MNLPAEAGRTSQGSLGNSWVATGAGNAQRGPVGERVADPNQEIVRKDEAIAFIQCSMERTEFCAFQIWIPHL